MFQVLLAVHLIICLALTGAILLQRSEGGGALGIGGGPGNVMSGRSASNLMVRATQILGALFFITSLTLTLMAASANRAPGSVVSEPASSTAPADDLGVGDLSRPLGGGIPASAPIGAAPATGAPATGAPTTGTAPGVPGIAPITGPAPAEAPAPTAPAEPAKTP
jgi:preprotein translocase subunit SecG